MKEWNTTQQQKRVKFSYKMDELKNILLGKEARYKRPHPISMKCPEEAYL